MADLRISELPALSGANLGAADLLPIVDVSASETKKITIQDAIGNGVTLIADATIPGTKILFSAGTIAGTSIANGGISATQIADDAVTAAKLADESTVDLVTTLPGSGAFVGQLALDTDDSKVYCWDGSTWVSFKAAGSINTVIGDTAGIVNLSIATSGDQVTITTSLDNTGAAAEFLAGPTASAGTVSYRQIASGDLPTASTSGKGAVVVNGAGLTMSGNQIVIDNTISASGSVYGVVQYSTKGLVTAGRAITAADLPAATSVDKGAVVPGTGLTAGGGGTLNHSNAVTAGTATKVTYDAQGHITAAQSLLDTDIPSLPASKINSGTLSVSLLGTNSITGDKLADSSTVQFGGASSTAGVVTFPTAQFKGQLFFDALNGDLYLYDGAAWQPITITAGELIYAGTYNANLNQVKSLTAAGTAAGLVIGSALPAASNSNLRYYLVVADSGTGTAPAPAVALAPPDMIVSSGTAWELIDVSNAIAGQIASNISFTPYGAIAATNVQTAIQELEDEKLAKAGGTVTGNLEIGAAGSLTWEGSTADAYETTLTVVDPTADRTITLPNVTGTVITTGDTGTVTSTMIADDTIVNADINASAAIAYSKLANLTAGNVLLGNASNVPTSTTLSGDVTLNSSGVATVVSGTTSTAGKLQLTDSISSTSTSTAATPNSVKTAYDLANAALPKAGGTITGNIDNSSTGYFDLPAGTTAERPGTPNSGMARFNTSTAQFEGYNGTSWGSLGGGDVTLAGANAFTGANTFTNSTGQTFRRAATQDGVLLRGRAGGTSSHTAEIVPTTLTASRTITLPDATGTVALLGTAQTFTAVQTLTDPAIIGTILEDIFTITDGAAFEVDPGNGSVQLITLGASRTPKATNFAAGESVTLMVNDGTAYTLTWTDSTWGTGGVIWTGGSAPTLATTGYTVIQFWKVGSQVYGALVGSVA